MAVRFSLSELEGGPSFGVWVTHMKTTVDIADGLLDQAKRLAARRGTTLKALIEEGLRSALERAERGDAEAQLETHVVQGNGLQPGYSWDDLGRLIDSTYEGRGT